METLPHSSSEVPAQFPIICVYLMSSNGSFVNNRRRRQCARAFAYVMAERRRSAHAIDDQNNGGRYQQENHVTRYLAIYLDQCTIRIIHESAMTESCLVVVPNIGIGNVIVGSFLLVLNSTDLYAIWNVMQLNSRIIVVC